MKYLEQNCIMSVRMKSYDGKSHKRSSLTKQWVLTDSFKIILWGDCHFWNLPLMLGWLWCHVGVVPLLGSVPAYYREVYEVICSRTDERVQVEVFQRLLQRTDLSKAVLGQVRGLHFTLGDKSPTCFSRPMAEIRHTPVVWRKSPVKGKLLPRTVFWVCILGNTDADTVYYQQEAAAR